MPLTCPWWDHLCGTNEPKVSGKPMWREKKTTPVEQLVASTKLKNITQIGSFPQVVRGENKKCLKPLPREVLHSKTLGFVCFCSNPKWSQENVDPFYIFFSTCFLRSQNENFGINSEPIASEKSVSGQSWILDVGMFLGWSTNPPGHVPPPEVSPY